MQLYIKKLHKNESYCSFRIAMQNQILLALLAFGCLVKKVYDGFENSI